MDIHGKTIWQQSAGDTDRNHVEVCTNFDVILNGPGGHGPWPACRKTLKHKGTSPKKLTDLRRFCEEMKPGDLVVLKLGTKEVYAVGKIEDGYIFHPEFGDIDGWDLQHVRRVRWLWKPSEPKIFDRPVLKFGDTTQHLLKGEVWTWLQDTLQVKPIARPQQLAALPPQPSKEFLFDEVVEFLCDSRICCQSFEEVSKQLERIVELAQWYSTQGEDPSEYETVSYLINPLLRLLGWHPQQMAIEWHNIDVALFANLPRCDKNLTVILEAKRRKRSCLHALPQATRYAESRPSCRRLILADGIHYWVYIRRGEKWIVYAHLNLKRLRSDLPIYRCAGAKEALRAMTPSWTDSCVSMTDPRN